jgi:hypothetical protein
MGLDKCEEQWFNATKTINLVLFSFLPPRGFRHTKAGVGRTIDEE